ncbi:hypothetical protein [Salinibacter sp.]|uniref:hypothetical protein n=1 Tax=Salinibacter sp. TaxID=2065818 RepID=UPI0035D51783
MDNSASSTDKETASPGDPPDWVGYWRVRRWEGTTPSVPTYYVATTESWDVVKREANHNPDVAAHPILEINGQTIVLKDEGEADENAERWRIEVDEETLHVTALTGPHEGTTGRAERIATDPRKAVSDETDEEVR